MGRSLDPKVGDKVKIVEDVRDVPEKADGKVAVYEGDLPRRVILWREREGEKPECLGECLYEQFMDDGFTIQDSTTGKVFIVHNIFAVWKLGDPHPDSRLVATVSDNPRMRLEDGSVIWGDECWWVPYEEAKEATPEQLQSNLSVHKELLGRMMRALEQEKRRWSKSV